MKLYEAIAYAIKKEGMEVIRTHRLVNYITDLQAYEVPAVKHIVATIINEGYGDKLYGGLTTGSHQLAFDKVSYQLTHSVGFQEKIVQFVLNSILYAIGKIADEPSLENEKPSKSEPMVEQKKPPGKNKNTINGYEYIDLGLSVKWATCNINANNPWDYGSYFAWGETSKKSSYTKDNSKTYSNSRYDNGIGGNISTDVASAIWGGSWRLPAKKEFQELLNNCTWIWTTFNDMVGFKVKSIKNGRSIFLPAAGYRDGTLLTTAGYLGYYWSSTPGEDYSDRAFCLCFFMDNYKKYYFVHQKERYNGYSIRPVSI